MGSGAAGMVAAYELMRLGLKPVIYEAGRIGGRLRSQSFEGAEGPIAELGGMRFPVSSTAFYHYLDRVGLTRARSRTRWSRHAQHRDRPRRRVDLRREARGSAAALHEVADAWREALEEGARSPRSRTRSARATSAELKAIWDPLVPLWDDRSFYDFVATSRAFASRTFRHREVFGQVGFGTGGWDTDFPNSMLEILRVVVTNCDEGQRLVVGGVEQLPRRLWRRAPSGWHTGRRHDAGKLHRGAARPGVVRIAPSGPDRSPSPIAGATRASTRPCW